MVMMDSKTWGYWSKPGLFTLVMGPDGSLMSSEVSPKDASLIRSAGGFLFDREAFAQDAAQEWSTKIERGAFTPIGKRRVFLLSRLGG